MAHCGDCKYFGFKGLVQYCRHPKHAQPLKKWGGKCNDHVDAEAKYMAHQTPPWPDPVKLAGNQ